jgi:hypothetical protein
MHVYEKYCIILLNEISSERKRYQKTYRSIARRTLRSAALAPERKFLIMVSALLNNESAPSTALEHKRRTKSSVTRSEQF